MLIAVQLTLGAGATKLSTGVSSAGSFAGAAIGRVSIHHMLLSPPAHTCYIGNSNVDSTHGLAVAANTVNTNLTPTSIGPFSGEGTVNTDEVYILGTQNDVVQVLLVC